MVDDGGGFFAVASPHFFGGDMPSTSKAQEKLMRAVAHSRKFAKKVDIPQKVGKEFERADKEKHARKVKR
jgi:hypothetical protein